MTTNYNNLSDLTSSNSAVTNSNSFFKTSLLVLALGLSSNHQLSTNFEITTITTRKIYNYDGGFSYAGTLSNIQKPNFMERYSKISNSNWFSNAYDDRSLGEILSIQ